MLLYQYDDDDDDDHDDDECLYNATVSKDAE